MERRMDASRVASRRLVLRYVQHTRCSGSSRVKVREENELAPRHRDYAPPPSLLLLLISETSALLRCRAFQSLLFSSLSSLHSSLLFEV